MKAIDIVRAAHPEATVIAVPGTYVGGKVRYEIRLSPNARKPIAFGMRQQWAWAEAMRALGLDKKSEKAVKQSSKGCAADLRILNPRALATPRLARARKYRSQRSLPGIPAPEAALPMQQRKPDERHRLCESFQLGDAGGASGGGEIRVLGRQYQVIFSRNNSLLVVEKRWLDRRGRHGAFSADAGTCQEHRFSRFSDTADAQSLAAAG